MANPIRYNPDPRAPYFKRPLAHGAGKRMCGRPKVFTHTGEILAHDPYVGRVLCKDGASGKQHTVEYWQVDQHMLRRAIKSGLDMAQLSA